jgi:2'-5' RNA ligase
MSSPANVAGRERLRLFCALRLPENALDQLVDWQQAHLRGGRIVPREHLHVTLAFLGTRPASDLEGIVASLAGAARGVRRPIGLRVASYRETRSVAMLVLDDAEAQATAVADALHELLEALGVYRREARPWLPHVTVLRFRQRPRLRPPLPDLGAFSPSDAAVYHSALRPDGAQYTVLESVALGG